MKTHFIVSSLVAASLIAPFAMAEAPTKADAKASSDAETDKYYAAMQERYKKMQEQMERLRKAKDDKERQKIWDEHWRTMHEGMDIMMGRGGWGPGMMMGGMGMMHGGPGGMGPGGRMGPGMGAGPQGGSNMSPDMMNLRQRRLEQRMDMMQMMMDQMIERQGGAGGK